MIVQTEVGQGHAGILLVVGLDFCAVRTSHGTPVLIRYAAVASVRPALMKWDRSATEWSARPRR